MKIDTPLCRNATSLAEVDPLEKLIIKFKHCKTRYSMYPKASSNCKYMYPDNEFLKKYNIGSMPIKKDASTNVVKYAAK